MYLKEMKISNFRCFSEQQTIRFRKGLNVLVGENDSGKSAIIDAIRIVMGTTDQNWYRIEITDFHNEDKRLEIDIILKFEELSESEQAAFLECLSYEKTNEGDSPSLYIHWHCKYLLGFVPPRPSVTITTGINGDGPALSAEAKEFLRVTYLRPLRDSYSNMKSGKNSRLSQIIQGIPDIDSGVSEYVDDMDLSTLSISGIANLSNTLLAKHSKLKQANDEISNIVNSKMLLKGDDLQTKFEVAGTESSDSKKLVALLEKLDLSAHCKNNTGKVGLGTSNILSMACELLLNRNAGSSFLLIEEPEAHVHAQRQLRMIQSLQSEAQAKDRNQQIIVTTHSPLLASVVNLENITIVKSAKAYSLVKGCTRLDDLDYLFLERYLDATKANLFFAKSVIIVEGPSEELLIPTIAKLLGRDLTEYGVSVVNVRGTGMRRYARIFQRNNEDSLLDVKVACITDRDVMPDCAPKLCVDSKYEDKEKWPKINDRKWRAESDFNAEHTKEDHIKEIQEKADGQNVKTFVANNWTFEYDLAYSGLVDELIDAIVDVKYVEKTRADKKKEIKKRYSEFSSLEEKSSYIYHFFSREGVSKAEVAQQLAYLLENKYQNRADELKNNLPKYIVEAIEYVT